MTILDEAFKEAERLDAIERQIAERIAEQHREFTSRWPRYCRACGGWGGSSSSQSHPYGAGSATEMLFEPCVEHDACICHRCGEAGLSDTGDGPCRHCGWNFDDGLHEA